MELQHPFATVTPTLDGNVLALLAQHDVAFTTGQLHRLLPDYSQDGIRKVLLRLARQGVVRSERVGNAYSYRLNRRHLAAGPILQLASLRLELLRRIEEHLVRWAVPARYAAVYGSAARGTMTADSDIDLFLVRDGDDPHTLWDDQVHALAGDITAWTGNDARPLELTVADLDRLKDEQLMRAVLNEGLTVAGSRDWLVRQLRGQRRTDRADE